MNDFVAVFIPERSLHVLRAHTHYSADFVGTVRREPPRDLDPFLVDTGDRIPYPELAPHIFNAGREEALAARGYSLYSSSVQYQLARRFKSERDPMLPPPEALLRWKEYGPDITAVEYIRERRLRFAVRNLVGTPNAAAVLAA